jgi:membrane protease YdiL (CAAX protease family)
VSSLKAFIKKHPVLTYYALVFAMSWGGILLIVGGPGGIPGSSEQVEMLMPLVLLALFAGPSVAGLLTIRLVAGRVGLHDLLSRLLRWRVGACWYAAALLSAPLIVTTVLLALSLFSLEFIPGIVTTDNKIALLLFGIGWGLLGGGLLEELGWTGFAVPRLRLRYTAFTTALIVGLLHGCEPTRGDAHARESLSQHADPPASADRGAFLDVEPRIDCHPVGCRCSRRIGQRRRGLATTAPATGGMNGAMRAVA